MTNTDGWETDEYQEGGQPNGSGEIEPSDYREWFSPARETHHRRVITLTGPWENGPTRGAVIERETIEKNREAERVQREERTLREAREILETRASIERGLADAAAGRVAYIDLDDLS